MGALSIWHIIVLLAIVALVIVPTVRIVQRTGHSGWWCLLLLIPFGGFVGMWILAFGSWPALAKSS